MATHSILYNEAGEPVVGETPDTILVINNEDGTLYQINKDEVLNNNINTNNTVEEHTEKNKAVMDPICERNAWSEEETLSLIAEYKSHEAKFKSTTIRNTVVWQQIASKLQTHTALQCENRFKYLKAQYIKKVESLGPKNTGGTFVKFPYFDQFEAIFGTRPNIRPVALASSSQPSPVQEKKKKVDEDDCSSSDEQRPKKQIKKTNLQKHLEDLEKRSESREAARERRHQEILRQRNEALQSFNTFCANITDILKKKHNDN